MTDRAVVFCLPAYGSTPPEAAFSLAAVVGETRGAGITSGLKRTMQAGIDIARNDLVRMAFAEAATLGDPYGLNISTMWIDSDVCVPSSIVRILLAHDVPIASGLYHRRMPPFSPVVFEFDPFRHCHDRSILDGPSTVGGVGMGAVLIKLSVFGEMREAFGDEDWFKFEGMGEDVWFFNRCKTMSIPVLLDPRLRCGHIRSHAVTTKDWIEDSPSEKWEAVAPALVVSNYT